MIRTGSDFSGVGAFDQALSRLGIEQDKVFACDMDKYARQTYTHNYGEPKYYPTNVYDREIPTDPLDIYMTSPPCQAFSLAGSRKGENDDRGVLFYNSLEFIKGNKPRYFIFENVKGLLSDDGGKTFGKWVDYLGGKSVNGNPVIFPREDSVPYHIYYKVLNAKNYGVPQNRQRIFIVGIRDDSDNDFRFPKEEYLDKSLKDVLEDSVDDKYFLSDKLKQWIFTSGTKGWKSGKMEIDLDIARPITATIANCRRADTDNYISKEFSCKHGMDSCFNLKKEYNYTDVCRMCVDGDCYDHVENYLKIKSATKRGFEIATEEDSINFSVPNSKTRRGRVGKGVAQTLDTQCNQATYKSGQIRRLTPRECFRLMDFPESFDFSVVSDTQAYKQAGNSIVVGVLEKIIKNLKL